MAVAFALAVASCGSAAEAPKLAASQATSARFAPVGPDDPGCTVAVARQGDVVFAEAFGAARLDPTVAMTTDSVVDIGSVSKQFTATAILLLAQRGQVDLDASLATYLPDLPGWAEHVSLSQLLHHTSGIADYVDLLEQQGVELSEVSTAADALAALGDVTMLDAEPGTTWEYSNSNYFLLGEVVQAVTATALDDFLTDEVFEPLGLAMAMDPVTRFPLHAVSYEGVGSERTVADSRWEQIGDGGIQTTPSELVTWASQYWEPSLGGKALLDARFDDAAAMGEPGDAAAGRYGAGIEASDEPGLGTVLQHSGQWQGFVTEFVVVADKRLALAVTCTSSDTWDSLGIDDAATLLTPWVTGA